MTQLTIRNVDDAVRLKLKTRAAAKGRSLEAELREIITKAAFEPPPARAIGRAIRERFARLGGIELDIPPRSAERDIPDFSE
jgi:antitoxin FitA